MSDSMVWYAAYGSNLLRERFMAYLKGGPVPRADVPQHGARNAAEPVRDRPYLLNRPLSFGFSSKRWENGGVCFVDPHDVTPEATLGRAWLVTVEQLADVWAQENGERVGPAIDLDRLIVQGSADLGRGWYPRLEYLGELDGHPVATITCDDLPEPNAAGSAYLGVVGRGVIETWGRAPADVARYLAARPGNVGQIDPEQLAAELRG